MQRMTIQSPLSSLLVLVSSSKVSRPLTPHSLLRWRQCPPVSPGDVSPHQMLITMLLIKSCHSCYIQLSYKLSLGDVSPHQMLITMLVINRDFQQS